ncbi:MAG TPA: polysaccharide deacetylase family protein [Ignavibacteriaceae bacterium]|nr:polysaccharide deacetylase family protein [Ignavibacteriaceae bacterium]
MKKLLYSFLISFSLLSISFSQTESYGKNLLIRCDDIGMSHSVNLAAKELIDAGLIFSVSVMVPCPWFEEAVSILKDNLQITAGIHLTLNSEWKNYRWGPVAGKNLVSSLVDSLGYFFPSRADFFANNPKSEEVEIELRAQIEKALKSGLNISYLDYHMSTAVDRPELRKIVEKLADEFKLGISRYFGEVDLNSMYSYPIEEKENHLINVLDSLINEKVNLLVCHIGKDNDELGAMIDMNSFGLKEMSKHRNTELNALLSAVKKNTFSEKGITLINYKDMIKKFGLESMKSPIENGY